MEKIIEVDGKKFRLEPIEEEYEETVESVLDGYTLQETIPEFTELEGPGSTGVKRAVPKVSEYREKFKKRELSLRDLPVRKQSPTPRIKDPFTRGSDFFGPGLEEDLSAVGEEW